MSKHNLELFLVDARKWAQKRLDTARRTSDVDTADESSTPSRTIPVGGL